MMTLSGTVQTTAIVISGIQQEEDYIRSRIRFRVRECKDLRSQTPLRVDGGILLIFCFATGPSNRAHLASLLLCHVLPSCYTSSKQLGVLYLLRERSKGETAPVPEPHTSGAVYKVRISLMGKPIFSAAF